MKRIFILFSLIIGVYLFLYVNNHWIVITEHVYESKKVPKNFDGFRIAQVSDLHDASFGIEQSKLVEKVRETNPDIIVITGDVIDSNRYDLQQSLKAVEQFVEIAEVYYVIGNHEVAMNRVRQIYGTLKELGVHILPNTFVTLERHDEVLNIMGIEDPLNGFETQTMLNVAKEEMNENTFTILLAHRPEMFYTYVVNDIDLVFSGHAHGGQVRIPFIGGLFAPSQGFLPTYTAGIYEEDETTMAVSRGLGNSTVPFRILNLPEIVVVELKTE